MDKYEYLTGEDQDPEPSTVEQDLSIHWVSFFNKGLK